MRDRRWFDNASARRLHRVRNPATSRRLRSVTAVERVPSK
jgi:hypothetical protein